VSVGAESGDRCRQITISYLWLSHCHGSGHQDPVNSTGAPAWEADALHPLRCPMVLRQRAIGIESTSEVWESTKPFVGRSAAFMRPRRRRGSSEKARSRWQFRCIAALCNQLFFPVNEFPVPSNHPNF
jgi:hypothetical protein